MKRTHLMANIGYALAAVLARSGLDRGPAPVEVGPQLDPNRPRKGRQKRRWKSKQWRSFGISPSWSERTRGKLPHTGVDGRPCVHSPQNPMRYFHVHKRRELMGDCNDGR